MDQELRDLLNAPEKRSATLPSGKKIEMQIRRIALEDMESAKDIIDALTAHDDTASAVMQIAATQLDELSNQVARVCDMSISKKPVKVSEVFKVIPMSTVVEIMAEVVDVNKDFFTQMASAMQKITRAIDPLSQDGEPSGNN